MTLRLARIAIGLGDIGMFGFVHARVFRQMVDDMPVNVMTCRLSAFEVDYTNKPTLDTPSGQVDRFRVKVREM